MGNVNIIPCIVTLGSVWSASHPGSFNHWEENPWYPLGEAGWAPEPVRHFEEKKSLLLLSGFETQIVQPGSLNIQKCHLIAAGLTDISELQNHVYVHTTNRCVF
jgi:hypothetical protein